MQKHVPGQRGVEGRPWADGDPGTTLHTSVPKTLARVRILQIVARAGFEPRSTSDGGLGPSGHNHWATPALPGVGGP